MSDKNLGAQETIRGYGMTKLATFEITMDCTSVITFVDEKSAAVPRGLYAWIIDGQIVRIGSSKNPLAMRIKSHGSWIEARLKDTFKVKDPKRRIKEIADAERWKKLLCGTGRVAEVWGREGTIVETPAGTINTYLAEENALLERHKPPLNNSHFR